jgi:hypothetical protein
MPKPSCASGIKDIVEARIGRKKEIEPTAPCVAGLLVDFFLGQVSVALRTFPVILHGANQTDTESASHAFVANEYVPLARRALSHYILTLRKHGAPSGNVGFLRIACGSQPVHL